MWNALPMTSPVVKPLRSNRPSRSARGLGALTALALTAVLAGCAAEDGGGAPAEDDGFAELSPGEIQEAVVADMAELKSVRMSGELNQDGTEIGIDLALDTDGVCAGSLTVMDGTAQIIAGPDGQFLKGDEAFWASAAGGEQAAAQVVALLGEKWAKVPDEEGGFSSFCDLDQLLDEFDSIDSTEGSVTVGAQEDIGGVPSLELISDDETPTTAWVATSAPHYIVKVTAEGEESGSIVFSDFDEPVEAQAPAESDVVDLSKL